MLSRALSLSLGARVIARSLGAAVGPRVASAAAPLCCSSDRYASDWVQNAVAPREPAPEFTASAVVGTEFKTISLADYQGQWLVLFSYPLDWTFVCPSELVSFSDRIKEFEALNTKVAAWSVDSKFSHLAWIKAPRKEGGLGGGLTYPLISDLDKSISRAYGVLIEREDDPDVGVALRGTFIIDPKGVVRSIQINDLPVGRSVDEVLRLVEAFQHTETHGEVCPANWKKGEKTMIAEPIRSLEYFKTLQ